MRSYTAVALNEETMKFDTITSEYEDGEDFKKDLRANGYNYILALFPTTEFKKMINKEGGA